VGNANDRRQVDEARLRDKAARASEIDEVRYLMSDPRGRSLVKRFLEATGVDRALTFQPNAMLLAHDVGVQKIGHWLLDEVRIACPEQELVMRREAAQRAARLTMQEDHDANQSRE
jgi:hypothetical protein